MTNKPFTIYINTRPFKVDLRTYICHQTRQFKGLQPASVYNDLIRSKCYLNDRERYDYCINIIGRKLPFMLINQNIFRTAYLLDIWMLCNYVPYLKKVKLNIPKPIVYGNALTMYMNFNDIRFSDAYESLQPLSQFYHSLIFRVTKEDTVEKRLDIYPEDIDEVLKDMGSDVRHDDIKDDIGEHLLILNYGDHYKWSSKSLSTYLWTTDYTMMYRYNLYKLLTMIKYEVPMRLTY